MSTITAAAVNSIIQDVDNAIRQGLTSGNIEQAMKAQKANLRWLFDTKKSADLSAEVQEAYKAHVFLWGFVVAWKGAGKKADNAFIATQRAQLVCFDTAGQAPPASHSAPPPPRPASPTRQTVTAVGPVLAAPTGAPTPLSPRLATPTAPSPRLATPTAPSPCAVTSRPARPAAGAGVGRTPGGRDSAGPGPGPAPASRNRGQERDGRKGKRKARAESEGEEANGRAKLPRKVKATPVEEEEDEEMDVDDEAEEEEEEPRPAASKSRPPPRIGSKMMERECDRCKKGGFECWEQARGISACHHCGTQRVACTWDGKCKKGKKKNDPIHIDVSSSEEDEEEDEEEAPRWKKKSAPASKGKGKAQAKPSAPGPKKRPAAAKASVPTRASAHAKTLAPRRPSAVDTTPAPGPSKKSAPIPGPSTPQFAVLERDTSAEPEDLMDMVERMETLVSRVEELERQVDDVDTSNGDHNLALVGFGQKFLSLQGRIDKLEKTVRHQGETIGKMNSSLEWLDEGQQALQVNVKALRDYVGMPVPIPASRQSSPVSSSAEAPVPVPRGAPSSAVSTPSAPVPGLPPSAPVTVPVPAIAPASMRSSSVPALQRASPPSRAASAQHIYCHKQHQDPARHQSQPDVPPVNLIPPTPDTSQEAAEYATSRLVPTPPSTAPTTKPPVGVELPAMQDETHVPLPPRPRSHSPPVSPAPDADAGAGGDIPADSDSRPSAELPSIPPIVPEQPSAQPSLLAVPHVDPGRLSPRRSRHNSPVPESGWRRSPRNHTRSPSPAATPSSSAGGNKRPADATAEESNAKRARQS
ncbi:hypothetical protein BDZ97DRAFT_1923292 [Flammula alnicola]|nr:hypothetical protein BDZ97DRAFT_1923292 [Flammula alnicola]